MIANPYWGIPIVESAMVPQGQFILLGDPKQIIAGTRPFTEAELIIRRIVGEVFGIDWLKKIGAWQYSTAEILEILRSASDSHARKLLRFGK